MVTDVHERHLRSGRPTGGRPPQNPGVNQGLETAYYGSQKGEQAWSAAETDDRVLLDLSRNPPEGSVWRVTVQADPNIRCALRWGGGAASFALENILSGSFAVPGRFALSARKVGGLPASCVSSVLPAQGALTGARVLVGVAGGGNAQLPWGAFRFTAAVASVVDVAGPLTPSAALPAGQTIEVSSGGSVVSGWGFVEVYL
jgi:hypothetical protein